MFLTLALFCLAAVLFLVISDDFVLGERVVPGTDDRVEIAKICVSLAGAGWVGLGVRSTTIGEVRCMRNGFG